MTNTMFWIEQRLWGRNTTGYHLTNGVLHIVESLLIWIILRKLSIPGAFLAAMLFAVHPVNVESVAWIAQRKNVLAMLFLLLSILWYLKSDMPRAGVGTTPARSHGGPWERVTSPWPMAPSPWPLFYWLSLAAFVLAMLSKGSAAVLPVLLLVIVRWPRPQGTVPILVSTKMGLSPYFRRDLLRTAPFFAVAAALTVVNVWFQMRSADTAIRNADFVERLLGAGGVVWFYLYKAILPIDLAFIYPQWNVKVGNPLWWLPLFGVIVVTAALWHYRKGWSRSCLFAWIFFCIALVPVMGFTDVGFMKFSLVADHYQHIALIGVVALVGAGWISWRRKSRGLTHVTADVVAIAAVGIIMFLAWRQNGIYRDAITLYQATLMKNQDCWMVYDNLGEMLFNAGRTEEAEANLEQALRLKPDSHDAHHNLGNVLVKLGRLEKGMEHYEQALHYKPDYPLAHNSLGSALVQAGRMQEAIEHFKEALRLEPEYFKAYNNLALAYVKTHQSSEAIATAQKALDIARSKNDTVRAKQIEDWLNSYRAGLSGGASAPHSKGP
ncbi:MAG: tetratricopeptide repeat protein [Thermoguttaceae bacterium]|jgi:tetratricopeptide (TPR) repeat protein